MGRLFCKFYLVIIAALIGMLLLHCGKKEDLAGQETIIARIGDKTISQNEFIRRAEYTIRPVYCRGDDYIHKKIVLNSLVAEKLLALEAGEDNELLQNEEWQLYLRGRKEQAMRQWLYYQEGYKKVVLDTAEVKKFYQLAGRKYRIAYYTIKNDTIAALVARELHEQGRTFEEVYGKTGSLEGIPQREVAWNSPEHEVIHTAMFSDVLQKDQVLGPLKIEDNYHVVIKVLGWTEELAITDTQIQKRWRDVSEGLTEQKAEAIFEKYVLKVMRGKKIEFNPSTFRRVVNIVGPFYLRSFAEKEAALKQQLWNQQDQENILNRAGKDFEAVLDEPFFRIDGKIWSVRDFEREVKIHPLVFRKKRVTKGDFAEQFKLAVVDMVRDRYLAEEAYKKGYDRVEVVRRNVEMWKDNLLFLYQLNKHLKAIGKQEDFGKEYMKIIETDLNPYVDRLQAKYANKIEINTDAFEKIKLTRIDMMVIQQNVPFPIVVPGFPVITTDHQLDYGRKMK
ncbi:MAG: hypothetical protein ONB44_07075 [candidate division KSB1 bacterium]|nr:hypothetical protein [candidate division KSB1 bacterium]MDZ7301887.1 hypothetical protein [candidate division KSB1 bacterium]